MAVTAITFDEAHYDLLVRAKNGASTWTLLAYLPGQDSGRAEIVCGAVTLGGGVATVEVVTMPTAPEITLTSAWRFTFPITDNCTDTQAAYLHADQKVQWS